MKVFLVLLLVVVAGLLPFVWMKKPWALRLWGRAKLVLVVYALVIAIAAIVRLVVNWDAIYG